MLDMENPGDKNGFTPLHSAAHGGHLNVFKFIIDKVMDKNPANTTGISPLHLAASKGHLNASKGHLNV